MDDKITEIMMRQETNRTPEERAARFYETAEQVEAIKRCCFMAPYHFEKHEDGGGWTEITFPNSEFNCAGAIKNRIAEAMKKADRIQVGIKGGICFRFYVD